MEDILDRAAADREAYLQKWVVGPGFHRIPPSHAKLQAQLIDFGISSGPGIAIQKLQTVLGVEVDGELGAETLGALEQSDPAQTNSSLAGERIRMIGRVVTKNKSSLNLLVSYLNRATEFL